MKPGCYFYHNILKTSKIGEIMQVNKDDTFMVCEIVEKCDDKKYKLKIIAMVEKIVPN